MSTHLFVASTAFGLSTLAAAIKDGAWAEAGQRILIISNNSTAPEATPGLLGSAGIDRLTGLFDQVYDYNELISPLHPSEWRPTANDLPLLQRLIAGRWGLDGLELRLIVESIQAAPALTLARIFADAPIDVYADGLMSYSPTRVGLYTQVGCRIDRLFHLDLAPTVTPLLLREWEVRPTTVEAESFRQVITGLDVEVPKALTAAPKGSVAVLLGQYLSALNILTQDEEIDLLRQLISRAVAAGFTTLVFKPHPSAPDQLTAPLFAEAERLGADLAVHDDADLVESWFDQPSIGLVVGCFSTALLTAATCYGLPTARVGTDLALERVRPYENSNRIPVTLIDALVPEIGSLAEQPAQVSATRSGPDEVPINDLVRMVGYCMQPGRNPDLRPTTERLLSDHWESVRGYVKRRRLTILDLPGRLPSLSKKKRRLRSKLRRAVGRILGPRISRLIGQGRRSMLRAVRPVPASAHRA
ncbi:polysialyltransferase family glycosyltransferase [Microlunatus speluncae]|uniref:polysialyltransferase family glycosyltransferase n=1 Tax=Microlunatus speluncae TaxID=2594267 RepID=UPI001583F5DD|nr:polysialyltransferase family glycosyltransferase [Microlunatus speluncae]